MPNRTVSKRDCPRIKVTAQARIVDPDSQDLNGMLGQVVDVSMEGISLNMNSALEFDRRYAVKLSVYPNFDFDFNCQVVWATIENGKKLYGLEFLDARFEHKLKLQHLVLNNFSEA